MGYRTSRLEGIDFGLFRIGGPGLGNLLFPIARAAIKCRRDNKKFLWPTLRQIKIGPLLRGENDLRLYGDIFIHRDFLEVIRYLFLRYSRNFEGSDIEAGLGDFFCGFSQDDAIYLKSLLRGRMRANIKQSAKISVHIRRGDFSQSSKDQLSFNDLLDITWFDKHITKFLRDGVKRKDITVYSSDIDDEVLSLLEKHDLGLSNNKCPLNTILEMSGSEIIIPSLSTFSLWAIFLGQSKFILPENCDLPKYMNDDMKSRNLCNEAIQ